ncbi:putative peptidoglycan binding protein [Luteibacter rhizovicinus]|uniref:Putative peptidoglycan binding protein n=1 Tax=Luteibacter rhizovicinus TaxID=242606 RepID=A0A4R3YXE4_9GAMM|nr:peptidoglycan-binding domain-containing protein [Luteibacter rhizovicinus]TCV97212.1 putative peptidoglycan binding protein [Luteibacter rhizovicinus]
MPGLTDNEAKAVAYFAIGVSSEGADQAYRLSFAGNTTRDAHGNVQLHPVAASGYSIGTLQSDLGQSGGAVATQLVDSYQTWAHTAHPDWALSAAQRTQTIADFSRNGHQINADHGRDIDPSVKSHMNEFLASNDGVTFVHNRDVQQVDKLMTDVVTPLRGSQLYQNASADDQARLIAISAKAYNQSERWGQRIVNNVGNGTYHSVADVSGAIDQFPGYMQSGRDAALRGADLFNTMQHSTANSSMHAPWQNVVANPLVNPTQLSADTAHPHLGQEYHVVKDAFVDPAHGKQMVNALEAGGSYAKTANGRGFYAEGRDFVEWDKAGHGRAFVGGQWSDVSRSDISTVANRDHTLDLNIRRNGADERLLHVTHPGAVTRNPPAAASHSHASTDHVQRPGSLREHDHGPEVHALQTQMAQLGLQGANGRPITPDSDFGGNTKSAVEAFQRSQNLHVDGIAGAQTLEALNRATQQQAAAQTPATLTDAAHPGNAMYQQALGAVHRVDAEQGRTPDQRSHNLAAALAVAGHGQGLNRIDHVVLSDDATRAFAVQGDMNSPFKRYTEVNVGQAVGTPIAQSSAEWQRNPQQPQPVQTVQQPQQAPQADQPSMHR